MATQVECWSIDEDIIGVRYRRVALACTERSRREALRSESEENMISAKRYAVQQHG